MGEKTGNGVGETEGYYKLMQRGSCENIVRAYALVHTWCRVASEVLVCLYRKWLAERRTGQCREGLSQGSDLTHDAFVNVESCGGMARCCGCSKRPRLCSRPAPSHCISPSMSKMINQIGLGILNEFFNLKMEMLLLQLKALSLDFAGCIFVCIYCILCTFQCKWPCSLGSDARFRPNRLTDVSSFGSPHCQV